MIAALLGAVAAAAADLSSNARSVAIMLPKQYGTAGGVDKGPLKTVCGYWNQTKQGHRNVFGGYLHNNIFESLKHGGAQYNAMVPRIVAALSYSSLG